MRIDRSSDIERQKKFYNDSLKENPSDIAAAVGWTKGGLKKSYMRFDALTRYWEIQKINSCLDIGCGLGSFFSYLKDKTNSISYKGIDFNEESIVQCKRRFANSHEAEFICGDFLPIEEIKSVDCVLACGIFCFKNTGTLSDYEYIEAMIKKMVDTCNLCISCDFLSDKGDIQYEDNFYASPERILEIAYKYSKNVALFNDYFPFEFGVTIFKDDSFDSSTVFNQYKARGYSDI